MSTGLSGLRVLVVEDDLELRNLTELILVDEEAEVRTASLGCEALAILDEPFVPEVVLLDARLPDSTGVELAEALEARCPGISLVLVSGDTDGIESWLRRGGLALSKPFEIDELLAVVRRAARARAA